MRKINFTRRELLPYHLINMSEILFASGFEDVRQRSITFGDNKKGGTTKFDEILREELIPIFERLHSTVSFLNYCYHSSAMPENELMHDNYITKALLRMLMAIDNKEIEKGIIDLGLKAEEILNKKRGEK